MLVLKTSWTRLQDMSSRRFQDVFSVTIFRLPRRLEYVLKTSCKTPWRRLLDVLKTSWKTKNCYAEDVLKTSWRHVFKTSSRHVYKTSSRHVFKTSWRYLYLKNLNGYASNKSTFHKWIPDESKVNLKSSIRTQWFQYSSYFKIQAAFLFWELKSLMTVWCCEISWIQIRHYRTGEAIKTKF